MLTICLGDVIIVGVTTGSSQNQQLSQDIVTWCYHITGLLLLLNLIIYCNQARNKRGLLETKFCRSDICKLAIQVIWTLKIDLSQF